jgi:hypothetical protein
LGANWAVTPELQAWGITCQLYAKKTHQILMICAPTCYVHDREKLNLQGMPPETFTTSKLSSGHLEKSLSWLWKSESTREWLEKGTVDGGQYLRFDWIEEYPAPVAVLDLLSYNCSRICKRPAWLHVKWTEVPRHVSIPGM